MSAEKIDVLAEAGLAAMLEQLEQDMRDASGHDLFQSVDDWADRLSAIRAAVGRLYAAPPATVPVAVLQELAAKWRNQWADGYETGVPSIDDATNNRISQAEICADELAALIGEKA